MEQQLALFDREVFSHPEFSYRNNLTADYWAKRVWINCIVWIYSSG